MHQSMFNKIGDDLAKGCALIALVGGIVILAIGLGIGYLIWG